MPDEKLDTRYTLDDLIGTEVIDDYFDNAGHHTLASFANEAGILSSGADYERRSHFCSCTELVPE